MQRTITIHMGQDQAIFNTIEVFNECTNYFLKLGFDNQTHCKRELQTLGYYEARKMWPQLQSSLVQGARDCACNMLKREKCKVLPKKKALSAIRYNQRTFKAFLQSEYLSVSTIEGRKKIQIKIPVYFKKYIHGRVVALRVRRKKNNVVFDIIVEMHDVETKDPDDPKVLGVDRGIINIVVDSDNQFHNSRHLRKVRGRYRYLRKNLQSIGTRSAKRKLKRLSGRERRFRADVNHCISKGFANSDSDVIVLEDLHIKGSKKKGKRFNKMLGGWAFANLEQYIRYKCDEVGKTVLLVPPEYTSKMCSRCGDLGIRKKHSFHCKVCGLKLNADLNAARNIAKLGKALIGRPPVNRPIVAGNDSGHGTPVKPSYKPPVLTGGY